MEGVVMENTAFPSHNPQRVLRVGVEPVQIDVRSAITALAKIVREEMLSGRTVDLANLGSFKVVSNGKRVETEKAVTAETLKTPRIQFFPKLEMRNQAKNVQHVVIRESEAGSAKPSPNPGDLPEAPDSAL